MNTKKCPVCLGEKVDIFFSVKSNQVVVSSWGVKYDHREIFQCQSCGLRFDEMAMKSEDTDSVLYDHNYHIEMNGLKPDDNKISGVGEQNNSRLELVSAFKSDGVLLDIGCSTGEFLKQAEENGFEVFGVDPSDFAAIQARKLLSDGDLKVEHSTIHNSIFISQKKVDIVTMWDVIEHFSALNENMTKIVGALTSDSVMVVRTPNTSSIFFRLAFFIYKLSFGRIAHPLLAIYHNDHHIFFTPKSLELLLNRMGLTVLKIYQDPLLWKRFRYCECRRGIVYNLAIGFLYWVGRFTGQGHGMILIAKPNGKISNTL